MNEEPRLETGAEEDGLPRELALAFAPLHKRAFGVAVGLTLGLCVSAATVAAIVHPELEPWVGLLSQFFAGYSVSWTGALVGFAWGFVAFFTAGWFAAFVRNLVLAINLFIGRARAEMEATRDFLDHI